MDTTKLTYLINGCAMKVHSELGLGFQELIYSRALAAELSEIGISFQRELPQTIYYKGYKIGTRRADFIVEQKVIIELKAVTQVLPQHFIQTKNYLTAYGKEVALLINFGNKSLEYNKIYPNNTTYKKLQYDP